MCAYHRYVARVIQELGLSKAKNTIIGNERKRGVSGGERRVSTMAHPSTNKALDLSQRVVRLSLQRVMIAVELISNPSILFLDGKCCNTRC